MSDKTFPPNFSIHEAMVNSTVPHVVVTSGDGAHLWRSGQVTAMDSTIPVWVKSLVYAGRKIECLEREIKELKERIDSAKEYILESGEFD